MRWLPPLAFVLTGVLLASCNLAQQVHAPPHNAEMAGGIPIGQPAPEIEGEDLDGVRFKLSDYRGKVVALVFWATWCPPCRNMMPYERDLVSRLEGQPFALLSVNSDANRDTVKNFASAKKLNWRMWWDGKGAIVQQYHVNCLPTIYVLDERGVVRYRDVRGPDLEQAVDALLREMPKSH